MSKDQAFGALLRSYRQEASLSQAALAERARLSTNAIAALERGRSGVPRPATVLLLADALGLGPAHRDEFINAAGARRSGEQWPEDGAVSSLPTALTTFVGREQELADVQQLLVRARLLTLTGVGGIGKTRLAIEAARAAGEIAFVELASIADERAVPHAVAAPLGVREQPQRPMLDTLIAALRARRVLLVLDNCEHVVATCAELVDVLLRACPTLRVLATSREALGIGGEVLWQVPSLSLPKPQAHPTVAHVAASEAVQLFVERAQSVAPSFLLTEHNAQAVAEVCAKLDGIPLAIELAAARTPMLVPEQIAARLDDRFRVLGRAHRRTAPARHQTLRAAIDWSYELLSPEEQDALAQLSVFAGGWTLEAAEEVCVRRNEHAETEPADLLDVLSGLVDKSLVLAEPRPEGVRYRLLETIRQYAAEHLAVMPGATCARERHRHWYVKLGQHALSSYWWGRDLLVWLARLEREQDNFRAALRFSLESGDAETGLCLAAGIWVLWGFRGSWTEGREWVERLLALPDAGHPLAARADALTGVGQMAFQQGDYAAAQVLLAEAVDLQRRVGDARGLAMALTHAGIAARGRGSYTEARALHEEGVRLSRAAANKGYEAVSLAALAHAAYLEGDYGPARLLAEEALSIVSKGERGGRSSVDASIPLYVLGRTALCIEDYPTARERLEETVALWRTTGDLRCAPGALAGLSCVAIAQGDQQQAAQLLRESLVLSEDAVWRMATLYALEGSAILAAARGEPEEALRLDGAASSLRTWWEYPLPPAEGEVLCRWLEPARRGLGENLSTVASLAGQRLSAAEALACARGVLCRALGPTSSLNPYQP